MSIFGNIVGGALGALAPLTTIGTSLLGGAVDYIAQKQTNDVNQGIANQANQTQLQQMAMEKEFAQNGISWRVEDAARNGISPLAALGASEPSYSPVTPVMAQYTSPLTGLGANIRETGQNVTRSLMAQQSPEQKASNLLSLQHMQKENDLLDVQIANARKNLVLQPATPPGIPAASIQVQNRDGTVSWVPSPAYHPQSEMFGSALWSLHNGIIPGLSDTAHGASVLLDSPDVRGSRFFGQPGNYYSTGGGQ